LVGVIYATPSEETRVAARLGGAGDGLVGGGFGGIEKGCGLRDTMVTGPALEPDKITPCVSNGGEFNRWGPNCKLHEILPMIWDYVCLHIIIYLLNVAASRD